MTDTERRRRRVRQATTDGPASPQSSATTAGTHDGTPAVPPRRGGGPDDRDGDRGLRGLVGSGTSQVSTSAALRARDASRPTGQDVAEAEASLVLVRRNWVPREELPRPGR